MLTRRHFLAAAATLGLLAGAAMPNGAFAHEDLKVVASFSILGDMVREVAGNDVALTTLVGPDGDAHVYEPTPADVKAVAGADIVFVNGLAFEGWMPRLLEASGFKGKMVVVSDGITPREWDGEDEDHDHAHGTAEPAEAGHDHAHEHADAHDHGEFDPHAWQNLGNGIVYVGNIARALGEADPDHAAEYQAAGEAYAATLKSLDERIRAEIAAIPEARRKVVTSHDAFGYFGAAYGIEFIAPQGVSTEAEASAGDVAAIIEQIRAEKIPAVFVENITDPRLVEQIARETGAVVGGELYSDALSGPDGPAPTYVKMFEFNAAALTKALAGS
ncbi:metal ABC transporter substrate-binding protein [Pseudoxanthobacter sp. M-2]|uniref:metal ABC transporter substrate-binding protein n=1 Tax=Pseudoxanthobacter sp. M-2 TaxID=3078754 RepID=UPI0038FC9B22